MSRSAQIPAPVSNVFEDLSGISTSAFSNPYDALIAACDNDPVGENANTGNCGSNKTLQAQIQSKYDFHRTARNNQQKAKLLDANFSGVSIDPILLRLSDPTIEPGYVDPRHCLVFWGRPTQKVKDLINRVQQELQTASPSKTPTPFSQECS